MVKTSVQIAGVEFKNRVLVASGTYGYGDDTKELVDVNKLGGIVTKSLSMKPRDGNPPPRIVETASGMLNSIGLANIGVNRFVSEKLPFLRTLDTAIIANIAASSIDEYCQVLDVLEGEAGIDGYEINVSCPNVKEGGLSFGTSVPMVEEITKRVRARTVKFMTIKLTPNVTHIAEFARAAESAGADAVSVINTVIGMAVNIHKRTPMLSTVTGGLSGPAIKPIALAKVFEVSKAVSIPIIGIGGIMNATDAIEFLMVGATAVEIGTANYIDPGAGIKIAEGIKQFCLDQNIADVGALVGSLNAKMEFSAISSWL
jgi:dihydroorotate dehydrogenase (NAD+) catalytic subunit